MKSPTAFLSYAREDAGIKDQIYSDLKQSGIDLWVDQIDIPVGRQWDRAIEEAIDKSEKFLVLMSEKSAASDVVLDEVNYALENKKPVIPVLIRSCKIPLRLRRIEMLDLTRNYSEGITQLSNLVHEANLPPSRSVNEPEASFAYHPGQMQRPSIVVMPFSVSEGDDEAMLISDGLLSGIVTALSHNPTFFVISSGTSRSYRNDSVRPQKIAQELRVQYVVMGNLILAGKRFRFNCELVNTQTDRVVWSDQFDCEVYDIFAIQDQIVRTLVHQLSRGLSQFEYSRVTALNPDQLSAWELYQRAMHYGWTYDWLIESISALRKAIELDKNLAEAHALLAARLAYMMWFGRMDLVAESAQAAKTALELAPDNSLCLLSASVVSNVSGQPDLALQQVERSLELNPNLADAWAHNGLYLAVLGKNEPALDMIAYAFELSPKDPVRYLWYSHQSICHTNAGDYEASLEACKKSTALHDGWFWSFMAQAQCHAMLDQCDEARECWEKARSLNPAVSLAAHQIWLQSSALDIAEQQRIHAKLEAAGCT